MKVYIATVEVWKEDNGLGYMQVLGRFAGLNEADVKAKLAAWVAEHWGDIKARAVSLQADGYSVKPSPDPDKMVEDYFDLMEVLAGEGQSPYGEDGTTRPIVSRFVVEV